MKKDWFLTSLKFPFLTNGCCLTTRRLLRLILFIPPPPRLRALHWCLLPDSTYSLLLVHLYFFFNYRRNVLLLAKFKTLKHKYFYMSCNSWLFEYMYDCSKYNDVTNFKLNCCSNNLLQLKFMHNFFKFLTANSAIQTVWRAERWFRPFAHLIRRCWNVCTCVRREETRTNETDSKSVAVDEFYYY